MSYAIGFAVGLAVGFYLGRYQGDRVARWLAKARAARFGRGGQ